MRLEHLLSGAIGMIWVVKEIEAGFVYSMPNASCTYESVFIDRE